MAGYWLTARVFLPMAIHDPFITWSCKISWKTETIINSALTVLVTTKCRRVPTVREVHLTMKSYETLILFLHEYVTNKKYWICATIMTITTKLGKVVKVVKEDISTIKLLDPSITLSCKVTGQIKYSLSKFYHLIIKFGKINILKFSMKPCFTKILYDVLSDTLTPS